MKIKTHTVISDSDVEYRKTLHDKHCVRSLLMGDRVLIASYNWEQERLGAYLERHGYWVFIPKQ